MSISELTGREPLTPLPEPAERARLRQAFGITMQQLADALHVNRRTVYMWETGQGEPQGDNRDNYASVLYAWAERLRETRQVREWVNPQTGITHLQPDNRPCYTCGSRHDIDQESGQ